MAFSLSLAAAVMVTISAVSILPQVFNGIFVAQDGKAMMNNAYDILLPSTKTIVKTRLLVERLFSLGLGVSAYLLLAKLLVFLPDPEHMFLVNEDNNNDDDNQAFQKRNDYDLFLASNDAMETGDSNRTDKETIRRRTTKRTTNHNTKMNTTASLSSESLLLPGSNGEGDFHDFVAMTQEQRKRSWRVALMLFVSLLIHNFPEGLCVAASAKESPELGITVAIGIFIHNVPEGIAISVPCIAAKPDQPWLAFWLASFSGLAEPLGAIVALTMLGRTKLDLENVLAFVAGVMTTVAFWELYPEAWKANDEELRYQQHYNCVDNAAPLTWKTILRKFFLQREYRPILWGTIVGTALMVATELYLP